MQQQMLAQSMQLQMLSHVPPAGNHVGMGPGPGFMPPPGAGTDMNQVHVVAAMAAQRALNGSGGMMQPHGATAGGYVNPAIAAAAAAAAATLMQRPDDRYGVPLVLAVSVCVICPFMQCSESGSPLQCPECGKQGDSYTCPTNPRSAFNLTTLVKRNTLQQSICLQLQQTQER